MTEPTPTPTPTQQTDASAPRPMPARRGRPDAEAMPIEVARLLSDLKCTDVVILDVRAISEVQDFLVLATGTSERQIRAVSHQVKHLVEEKGDSVYRTSADDQATWVVIDCVDLVVHLFEPNARGYYDLETMWGDAPHLAWARPADAPRPGVVVSDAANAAADADMAAQKLSNDAGDHADLDDDEGDEISQPVVVKAAKKAPAKKAPAKKAAKKSPAQKSAPKKSASKKAAAKKSPAAKGKATGKKAAGKPKAGKKSTVQKTATRKAAAKPAARGAKKKVARKAAAKRR